MSEDTQLLAEIRDVLRELLALSKSKRVAQTQTVDLDGPHGNPEIKAKSPKDWSGEDMHGRKFSECPPAYLRLLADRYDYFAQQETDAKKANYNRLDAARARGWAERIEKGWKPTAPAETPSAHVQEDEIRW